MEEGEGAVMAGRGDDNGELGDGEGEARTDGAAESGAAGSSCPLHVTDGAQRSGQMIWSHFLAETGRHL